MLSIQQGQPGAIIVTLEEKRTLAAPWFVFVFTHITTRKKVAKAFNSQVDDASASPERYNEFTLDGALFTEPGQYVYRVYESAIETTDPAGLREVENGRANVKEAAQFTYQSYNPETQLTAYGG